jgi:ribosomal protein S18 acetylase RimI-like enzyme
VRRVPFSPARIDEIVAFCIASDSPYDGALLRRLMLDLTSAPAGVLVVEDAEGPALVATVIDRTANGADAANLELLGVRGSIPAEVFGRAVVDEALAFARGGPRRALQVLLPPVAAGIADAAAVLRAAGFVHAYEGFDMLRLADAPEPAPPALLAAGWRWETPDGERAPQVHAALRDIFAGAPSFNLSPLEEFRKAVASGAHTWRVLLDGERIAGLVQVSAHGGRGELRTVGRVPAYRGAGLGPRLVAEGLRVLGAAGAAEVSLFVEARNEGALGLYRRFGFEVVSRVPCFTLALR